MSIFSSKPVNSEVTSFTGLYATVLFE